LFLVLPGIIAYHIFKDNPLNTQDMAYAALVRTVIHNPILLGLFAAVLFGAILSAFSGAINSTATLFVLNIYQPYIAKPGAKQSEMVKEGKKAAIVLVLFSMCVAPLISFAPQGLFQYLQMANGLYNVPIFTLILIGMFNKKVPAWAAKAVLIGFIIIYGFTQVAPMVHGGAMVAVLPGWLQWFVHLHFLHILAILFVISLVFMVAMGELYPSHSKFDIKMDKKVVDMKPWDWALPVSVFIMAVVIGLYILLSPIGIAK